MCIFTICAPCSSPALTCSIISSFVRLFSKPIESFRLGGICAFILAITSCFIFSLTPCFSPLILYLSPQGFLRFSLQGRCYFLFQNMQYSKYMSFHPLLQLYPLLSFLGHLHKFLEIWLFYPPSLTSFS